MAQYTIEAVSENVREYETKYGQMKSYKVKLSGEADAVEISQKATTPAPAVGSTLSGTIQDGEYGKKFKKEFTPNANSGGGRGSKPFDNFTMYLSYAKDIAVALIAKGEYTPAKLNELTEAVGTAGKELYKTRPDATATPTAQAGTEDKGTAKDGLDKVYNPDEVEDVSKLEIPF